MRSGNVYVLDSGNDRIQKFSSDGSYITQWGVSESFDSTSGPIYSSYGIAVDASGNVYVVDTQTIASRSIPLREFNYQVGLDVAQAMDSSFILMA